MIQATRWQRSGSMLAALCVLGGSGIVAVPMSVQAQTVHHHRNWAQKHPTATGVGAGVAAYAIAKKTGHNRARAGRRPNFAQRHPVLTGVAAGVVAHHYAKKHRQ